MNQKENIIKEYEKEEVVDTFDSQRSKYAYQRFKHRKESKVLQNAIKSCEEDKIKVLDCACGTGRMIYPIFSCGSNKNGVLQQIRYTGLDSSETMLNSIKQEGYNIELVHGDAEHLPFEDNTFDVVFTFHLLWHLPKEVQLNIIREMKRVCKKGGRIIIDIINGDFRFGEKTEGIYKWGEISKFPKAKIDKLNDFPFKNSFVYSIFNIINYLEKILPINLFHMIYITIQK